MPRDSYAHHYASDQNMRYTIIEPEPDPDDESAGYAIHHVECVTEIIPNLPKPHRYFMVDADMAERCDIEVRFYDEDDPDREEIQYYCEDLDASEMSGDRIPVILPYEAYFPDYFILDVRLIRRRDNKQMGETYITYDYTKRHAEIMNKTPEDYVGREVVSYGDAGYAVFEEGVIRTEGMKVSGGYVLTPPRELKKGDVLYLNLGDKKKAVKVQSFEENGDGTVTVTPDDDICLADVFARLDISGYMQPVAGSGLILPEVPAGKVNVIPLNPNFTKGPVTVSGTAGISVMVDTVLDKDSKYFSMECWVENIADLEITLAADFSARDDLDGLMQIPLGTAINIEIPGTDIGGELGAFLSADIDLEVGGSIFVNVKEKVGFTCNSDDKKPRKIEGSHKESNAYAEVKGDATIKVGPEISLGLDLSELLEAGIRGQVGLEVTGKLEGLRYGGSVSDSPEKPSSRHACMGCLNGDFNFFAGIWGKLQGKIFGDIEFDMFDEPIFSIDPIKLGDAYWSFLNEAESIYGGEPSAGFTECKNHQYYTHFTPYDYRGNKISAIPLTLPTPSKVLTGSSPEGFYLYPGDYSITAGFDSGAYTEKFFVRENAAYYPLEEPDVKITAMVVDNETQEPIAGALVEFTLPNGSKISGTTDAEGQFLFEHLPAGEYSVTASAQGYLSQSIDRMSFVWGTHNSATLSLTSDRFPVLMANVDEYSKYNSHFNDQALTEDGTCPDGVPEIWLKKTSYSNVQVTHEECSTPLSYKFRDASGETDFFAVHMGNGEYTYALVGYNNSHMGGTEIIVFRVKNGAFEILAKFDGSASRYDSNVTIDAKFTTKAKFSGVIQPTGYRFEGYRTANDLDYYDRAGQSFWRTNNLGGMGYEKNAQGYYDLIFDMPEVCYGIVGHTMTRYRMMNGKLEIVDQWFEPYLGELTYP